jgi:hypothetical protein
MPKNEKFERYFPIPEIRIKVKDAFALGDLITFVNDWLKDQGFTDYAGGDDTEDMYSHKIIGGGSMVDIWMWWRLLKYPEGTTKDTAYLRYLMNVDIHFMGDVAEVEVMHKGKKAKLNKGEVEFIINPCLELDFREEWKKQKLLNLVKEVFKKKIYKKEIDEHKQNLYNLAYGLQGVIKQFFKLESFVPEETTHIGPKGLI